MACEYSVYCVGVAVNGEQKSCGVYLEIEVTGLSCLFGCGSKGQGVKNKGGTQVFNSSVEKMMVSLTGIEITGSSLFLGQWYSLEVVVFHSWHCYRCKDN